MEFLGRILASLTGRSKNRPAVEFAVPTPTAPFELSRGVSKFGDYSYECIQLKNNTKELAAAIKKGVTFNVSHLRSAIYHGRTQQVELLANSGLVVPREEVPYMGIKAIENRDSYTLVRLLKMHEGPLGELGIPLLQVAVDESNKAERRLKEPVNPLEATPDMLLFNQTHAHTNLRTVLAARPDCDFLFERGENGTPPPVYTAAPQTQQLLFVHREGGHKNVVTIARAGNFGVDPGNRKRSVKSPTKHL